MCVVCGRLQAYSYGIMNRLLFCPVVLLHFATLMIVCTAHLNLFMNANETKRLIGKTIDIHCSAVVDQ
jgi:hypothetical protein